MMLLDWIGWILVIALFLIGMAGAIYPVLPGVLAIFGAFFVYGWFFGFAPFGWWFWSIQTVLVASVFIGDYASGVIGTKSFGGSKAGVWGSVIGLVAGPFVIPLLGFLLGPFIGAVIGEMLGGNDFRSSLKSGLGAVVGLFSGIIFKLLVQLVMIVLFVTKSW